MTIRQEPDASQPLVVLEPTVRRTITAALLLGTFLASVEVMVVGPAMPPVVEEFGNAGLYAWVFSVYILAQTLSMPICGALSDRWGRRDTYLIGVGLFVFGSVVCALAGSMHVVVLGRLLQGLGAGALVPLTMTIFGDLYPVAVRTSIQGMFSLVWGVSSLAGPALGGWLTETFSWRAIFWLNVLPGTLAAATVACLLPRWVGAGKHADRGWALLRLLRHPAQQAIVAGGLLLGAALLGLIGYLPVWVQAVLGGTPLEAGLALIPMSVSWTLAANAAGRLVRRTSFRSIVLLGSWCVAGGSALSAVWTAHVAGLVLWGVGMGLTISSFTVAAQEAAPLHLRGSATSLSLLARSLGGAIAVPVLGVVAGLRPGASDFAAVAGLADGVSNVFYSMAGCCLAAALILTWRFPHRTGRDADTST